MVRTVRNLHFALACALLGGIASLAACTAPPEKTRIRLTATVAIGSRLYTGSSVQELRRREGGGIWGSMDVGGCRIKGEAVYVDLKEHGNLFIIFKGKKGDWTSYAKLILASRPNPDSSSWWVTGEGIPVMMTFTDISNPATLTQVDPFDLQASFGKGAYLKSLLAQKTKEPLTKEISKVIPWVDQGESYVYVKTGEISSGGDFTMVGGTQRYHFKHWRN